MIYRYVKIQGENSATQDREKRTDRGGCRYKTESVYVYDPSGSFNHTERRGQRAAGAAEE